MHHRGFYIVLMLGQSLVWASTTPSRADVITLHSGGQVRGEIDWQQEANKAPESQIRTLSGATIVIDRQHVASVARRRLIVETYESLAKTTPDTVEAQWQLAEWCRDNQFAEERAIHLLNVVRLDPDHEKAHELLGHVRYRGQWMAKDDIKRSQGYVKYGSQYVTMQEKEQLEKNNALRDSEKQWHKKIRIWFLWAKGRNPERQKEGLTELQAVKDPDAIPGLQHFLGNNSDASVRALYIGILGQIPGERPVGNLVALSLHDEDADIRGTAFDALSQQWRTVAIPYYVDELRGGVNQIVRRAAIALGRIGDEKVVPYLIEALVTTHAYRVEVPVTDGGYAFNSDGSFGSPNGPLLPPHIEKLLRTGQLSNGVIVVEPNKPVRTKVITVRREHENAEVLAALTKLTGESTFGFDEQSWRVWWAAKGGSPASVGG